MSISNLLVENSNIVHANDVISDYMDTYAANPLNLGTVTANRVNIGTISHQIPFYINGVLYNAGGVTSMGPVGIEPNANGGLISSNVLTLEPASEGFPGVVSGVEQVFLGVKRFLNGVAFDNTPSSVPIVNEVMQVWAQANFGGGADVVTIAGCITSATAQCVITNLNSIVMFTIPEYLPVAGTYAAGLITFSFPASANVANPGAVPLEFVAGSKRKGFCMVVDGGVVKQGAFEISAIGMITIGAGVSATGDLIDFTVNGQNGLFEQFATYF